MSDIASTSPEPAYLARLALRRLPFVAVKDAADFYDGRHIKQRRLLLLHIVRSTQTPVLIHAEAGMGKTTVLQHLQRETARDLRFCTIDTHTSLQTLQQLLRSSFGVDATGATSEEATEQALKQRLLQLRNLNIVPVLLIDDAEKLASDVLAKIQQLLSWQNEEKSLFQAVMTSQTDSLLKVFTLQKIDLPVLDVADIPAYLKQRLESAGFSGDFPFDEKAIKRLTKLSQGKPAKLNQLAHQHLLAAKKTSPLYADWSSIMTKFIRWSPLIVLALIVIIFLSYQDKINDWISPVEDSETEIQLPELVSQNEITTVIVDDNNQQKNSQIELEHRDELADLLAEIPPAIEYFETETETETEVQLESEALPSTKQALHLPKTSNAVTDANQKTVEIQESKSTAPDTHASDWILSQKPTDYTFQLMGSWSNDEVTEFIDKNALTGQVARFTSLRDNKPWHVLIYGVFTSKKAALSDSNKWPAPLNTLPTWLRRFDSVQNQIKDKGVAPE